MSEDKPRATLTWNPDERAGGLDQPVSPSLAGRYLLLDRIGEGGMGVVHAAYDRELDRKVALKLIRPETGPSPAAAARLLREAQALARLSHPNVVAVHDVGTLDGQVFVAMELVDGVSLRAWLGEQRRTWREIVRVFVEAARGLEAAHRAGLVHRDFKPENVLIDAGGRVRVVDFGLARRRPTVPAGEGVGGATGEATAATPALAPPVTRRSAIVGTPLYMAPEQHLGDTADERSDQFAFCVALYEALYGVRPFAGETIAEVREAILAAKLREPPSKHHVPRRVHDALRIGLRADRDARWPSMSALTTALLRDPAVPLRRALGAATLLAVVGLTTYGWWSSRRAAAQVCRGIDAGSAHLWDESAQKRVRQAFLATGLPFAERSYQEVAAALDGYTKAIVAGATEACRAAQVTHEQSAELQDLRMRCLDRRRQNAAALIGALENVDAATVKDAPAEVRSLEDVRGCADLEALTSPQALPRDPALRARIDAIGPMLAEVQALNLLRRFRLALPLAKTGVAIARDLGYLPLSAELLLGEGYAEQDAGDYKAAERSLQAALDAALAGKADRTAISASSRLAVVASVGDRTGEAASWADLAWSLVQRIGAQRTDLAATVTFSRAFIAAHRSRWREAKKLYAEELALLETLAGKDAFSVARVLVNLASSESSLGEYGEARDHAQRALAIFERTVGPEHPNVANALSMIASSLQAEGRNEEAAELWRRAITITERAFGTESTEVSGYLLSLGAVYHDLRRNDEALRLYRRALAIDLAHYEPENSLVLEARTWIADELETRGDLEAAGTELELIIAASEKQAPEGHVLVDASMGLVSVRLQQLRLDDARRVGERALALMEKSYGAGHPNSGFVKGFLGDVALHQGRLADAQELAAQALAIEEKSLGPDHYGVGLVLVLVGRVALAQRRYPDALAALERAERLFAKGHPGEIMRSRLSFYLAQALWEAGQHERALELATQARDVLAAHHPTEEKDLVELLAQSQAWLAAHRR